MGNYAVIDIGSNTIRLCVYAVDGRDFRLLTKKRSMAGLASYVDKGGNLKDDGIKKLLNALKSFRFIYEPYHAKVLVFATASLRFVKNQKEVKKHILRELGLDVEIISGKDEAAYSFAGAMHCISTEEGLMVDIGGASTELVYFKNRKIIKAFSFPLGSLTCYEKYISRIIPTRLEQEKIKRDVLEFLDGASVPDSAYNKPICGVGGSIRNALKMYQVYYDDGGDDQMFYENFKDLLKQFRAERKEYLEVILKTTPHRVHTIIPGMIILKTIAKYFKCPNIIVSKLGIREGYLLKNVGKNYDAK